MHLCLRRKAYYNENNPYAAQWLRNLIREGLIADGEVDERSITEVRPRDLRGYPQCHFFGGVGGWSYALRLAGVPDDWPVWTGSCPCGPWSPAGHQDGLSDERHLWPQWFQLIQVCRPPVVLGEQVKDAHRWGWMDIVQGDLEKSDYAVGFAILGAHSVKAPHVRQRIFWVADADFQHGEHDRGRGGGAGAEAQDRTGRHAEFLPGGGSSLDGLGNADDFGQGERGRDEPEGPAGEPGEVGGLGDAHGEGSQGRGGELGHQPGEGQAGADVPSFWDDCEWIECRDGKSRPIRPGVAVLSNGVPARVAKLRALGNAIVPQAAAAFIRAFLKEGF